MDTKHVLTASILRDITLYKETLEKEQIPVSSMIVFGSYAKKTQRHASDIDVCVVSPVFGRDSFSEGVRLSVIAKRINILFEPHPYHPGDLANKYDALAREITRYGIRVL